MFQDTIFYFLLFYILVIPGSDLKTKDGSIQDYYILKLSMSIH
jgi:hypothetical protein